MATFYSVLSLESHQKEIHSSDAGFLLVLNNSRAGLLLMLDAGHRA